jgi:hypothetical protein
MSFHNFYMQIYAQLHELEQQQTYLEIECAIIRNYNLISIVLQSYEIIIFLIHWLMDWVLKKKKTKELEKHTHTHTHNLIAMVQSYKI